MRYNRVVDDDVVNNRDLPTAIQTTKRIQAITLSLTSNKARNAILHTGSTGINGIYNIIYTNLNYWCLIYNLAEKVNIRSLAYWLRSN